MVDLITLDKIGLELDNQTVLQEVSLKAKKGELHCILGPNGAGKTMTNKLIALLYPVSRGKILWDNTIINPYLDENMRLENIRKLGYMSQKPIFLTRTLRDNARLPLSLRNLAQDGIEKILDEKFSHFELEDLQDKLPSKMSIGQQQKGALLRAFIHNPQLIILDEPTASLDMANIAWFEDFIKKEVSSNGKIVFWTTHDMFQAKRIADVIHVIIQGKLLENGSPDEIFNNPKNELVEKYVNGELLQ